MAVKTKEEILEKVKTFVGDSTEDDKLEFLEDITDTLDDLSNSDGEDWKKKYEDNDKQWREKYRNRFFNNKPNDDKEDIIDDDKEDTDDNKPKTFEDLFKPIK